MVERTRLQKLCQENGALYSGQLVRESSTHLIVGETSCECFLLFSSNAVHELNCNMSSYLISVIALTMVMLLLLVDEFV